MRPVAFLAGLHARRQVGAFLAAHRRTRQVQDRLLGKLIAAHADTAFGREHGFSRIKSYEDFTSAVPVASYETLRPYLDRVFGGDTTALLPAGEKPLMFSMTSGTTGKPKYIPVTRRFLGSMRRGWNIFGLLALKDHPAGWLRPILQISSPVHETTSPGGVSCGAISGLLAATQKRIVRRMYVVPRAVFAIAEPQTKYYTILRCAVAQNVAIITTANPSSTIKLIETGRNHTERLIRDVADGTLNPPGQIGPELAGELRFKPNPPLARRLAEGVRRDGVLLPKHFWRPALLTNWTGGTLKLYMPRLREMFGDVPVRDIGLLASEGRFSIPIADGTPAGVAEITGNFLEFIPADQRESPRPDTLRAHELDLAKEYFIVISNWAGLWRYDIDDRIRVVDRYGQSPVFEFLSRGPHTANITGEKITEHQVVEAMRLACERLGVPVVKFVMQGRFAGQPYYELRLDRREDLDGGRLAELVNDALGRLNMEYRSKLSSGRLGPIRVVSLPAGTLEKIEARNIRRRRGRGEQYKHKYLITEIIAEEHPSPNESAIMTE